MVPRQGGRRGAAGPKRGGRGDVAPGAWHGVVMLMVVLILALLAVLVAMIVLRRWTGRLASLATLIAGAIMALWLAEIGLLPGSKGPLTADRPFVPGLDR